MNKKKKILVVAKSIDGGTGTFLLSLLKIQDVDPNIEIKALVLEKPSYRRVKKSKIKFLHSSNYYPQKYELNLSHSYNFFTEIFKIKREINKLSPQLVLSVDVHANLIVSIIKAIFLGRFNVILTTHINLEDTLSAKSSHILRLFISRLITFFYNKADRLVFISKDLGKNFKRGFKINRKIDIINYGITLGKRKNPRSWDRKTIVTLGRLVEQKDYGILINAFSGVIKDKNQARLWIVGDGPLKLELKNLAHSKGLDSMVSFLGWKNSVKDVLSKADIYVSSSKREGFGYGIIEAMSYGLPIVSTDAPFGPKEILGNGKYGILVPVGDKKAIKNNLNKLLEDRKEYLKYSNLSIERVKDFSEKKMLDQYVDLLNSINES
ncbi:MAG: hypothetical protein A3C30_02870 [Candidatus Levybacteria bacterium RIFCSPHIGHO2_02_FULL_40_18]|nr:MAG: hypothetical protein A2869_05110 [Candidatus Levybacteria bacterium RIFCSPHIGHO2_01_FULL_40_58]OGH26918.1 MAG: hypothetical protein A3C30_02870 [Candidatus Levybacteria bacterium RIFCSPHIGHO2_02_FULL_40_18]OGH32040.1 MAG: hypothetical protein A3E43_03850 [Candidatus Levybacteria bacterium RIFCSPHIGHO2_12_FULL_40_31]OGH40838.1 MAG: hypothetical protein A2894_04550 [Candidatus Levybacteria bacterium RIFCSPLOWO2_01_FULL_40_64]OGH48694.1 MAG: hypothetical protein A3I54_03480 [Candidatus Lev